MIRLKFPVGRTLESGPGIPEIKAFGVESGLPHLRQNLPFWVHGQLMLGTRYGIYRFIEATGRFEPDPRFKGCFPEGPCWVRAIREKPQGALWIEYMEEGTYRYRFMEARL